MDNNKIDQTIQNNTEIKNVHIQKKTLSHWEESIKKYTIAIAMSLMFFTIFSFYLYLRRGYYDLFIINKVFAGVATIQLGIVLLIGTASRINSAYAKYIPYRKALGIIAFFFAFFHTISSFFFLPNKFPLQRFFTTGILPFIFGLTAILILMAIFAISNNISIKQITPKRWWRYQRWGIRIAYISIMLHVFVMKLEGWINWYKEGGSTELIHPEWPGLGILIAWGMLLVVVVRITELIHIKCAKFALYGGIILLPLIYGLTFIWGVQFTTK